MSVALHTYTSCVHVHVQVAHVPHTEVRLPECGGHVRAISPSHIMLVASCAPMTVALSGAACVHVSRIDQHHPQ